MKRLHSITRLWRCRNYFFCHIRYKSRELSDIELIQRFSLKICSHSFPSPAKVSYFVFSAFDIFATRCSLSLSLFLWTIRDCLIGDILVGFYLIAKQYCDKRLGCIGSLKMSRLNVDLCWHLWKFIVLISMIWFIRFFSEIFKIQGSILRVPMNHDWPLKDNFFHL